MEQQVAMLLKQVIEVSDRLRQSEESWEQVRQLLEAHRTAGQMLEERMNRTEASVRDTSLAGGTSAARAWIMGLGYPEVIISIDGES